MTEMHTAAVGKTRADSHALCTRVTDDDDVVYVPVKRGSITIHNERVIHGSGANKSQVSAPCVCARMRAAGSPAGGLLHTLMSTHACSLPHRAWGGPRPNDAPAPRAAQGWRNAYVLAFRKQQCITVRGVVAGQGLGSNMYSPSPICLCSYDVRAGGARAGLYAQVGHSWLGRVQRMGGCCSTSPSRPDPPTCPHALCAAAAPTVCAQPQRAVLGCVQQVGEGGRGRQLNATRVRALCESE